MPMPVANIIDTQENLENSGTESSGPNLMLPYLLRARYAENSTNAALVRMNSQPNDPVTQDMALPVRSSIFFGAITPQTAKATRSTGGPFRDFTSPSEASSVDSDTVLVIGPPSSGGLRTSVDVDVAHRTPSRAMRNSSCLYVGRPTPMSQGLSERSLPFPDIAAYPLFAVRTPNVSWRQPLTTGALRQDGQRGRIRFHGRLHPARRAPRDTSDRRRRLPAGSDRVALRRRHRVDVLVASRQGPGLRPADRDPDVRRPSPVPEPGRRIAKRASRRPHPPRLRVTASHPPDLRIRRHDRSPQADRATPRLGRAGHPLAGPGLHGGRLRAWPRAAVHDAERPARRRPLRPRGRRAARIDVPPDRPRSAMGEETRRPRRDRRGGRIRRPRHRSGSFHPRDAVRGQPARHAPAAGGHGPRRRPRGPAEREDPVHAAQRRARRPGHP